AETGRVKIDLGVLEQINLLIHTEFTHVLDQRVVQVRLDFFFEISVAQEVQLAGQLYFDSQRQCQLDGQVGIFLSVEPADERNIIFRFFDEWKLFGVETVIDYAGGIETG